jgi:hypothetical protein
MFITAPPAPTTSWPFSSIPALQAVMTIAMTVWRCRRRTIRIVGKVVGAESADARTVVTTPGHISAHDVQIWMKTWHKALVDENKDLGYQQ